MSEAPMGGLWARIVGLFVQVPQASFVLAFANDLLKIHGQEVSLDAGEKDDAVFDYLEETKLLFRCDWRDTIATCGDDLVSFVVLAGADGGAVKNCISQQDSGALIFELANALNEVIAESGLRLLEIDEKSDGWLYCVAQNEVFERWENTQLSSVYCVFHPRRSNKRVPKGLHDGPYDKEVNV